MKTIEMINELRKRGYQVEARRRTDGGWIITRINNRKFSGAKGNQEARELLGVSLSSKRAEQVQYNVEKYIKGAKKPKEKVNEEMSKELRRIQRIWRKKNVQAKLTKRKLRWHIQEEGQEAARRYLQRMERYGKGYAYEENVYGLAQYIEDTIPVIKDKELAAATQSLADEIKSKVDSFKEEWISKLYPFWYAVNESAQATGMADNEIVIMAIMKTTTTIR